MVFGGWQRKPCDSFRKIFPTKLKIPMVIASHQIDSKMSMMVFISELCFIAMSYTADRGIYYIRGKLA